MKTTEEKKDDREKKHYVSGCDGRCIRHFSQEAYVFELDGGEGIFIPRDRVDGKGIILGETGSRHVTAWNLDNPSDELTLSNLESIDGVQV